MQGRLDRKKALAAIAALAAAAGIAASPGFANPGFAPDGTPLSGYSFACSDGESGEPLFEFFAPDEQATRSYRGNRLALYALSAAESEEQGSRKVPDASPYQEATGLFSNIRLDQIYDDMPFGGLIINWRREQNSPVELEISDYDAEAGSASFRIKTERNPSAAVFVPQYIRGSCSVTERDAASDAADMAGKE